MNNENFLKSIENYFGVFVSNNDIELETWTQGGVNMFVYLSLDSKENLLEQFEEYVRDFDVDEQIDLHRQDERYKDSFSIRESLNDFESYEEWLNGIVNNLEIA